MCISLSAVTEHFTPVMHGMWKKGSKHITRERVPNTPEDGGLCDCSTLRIVPAEVLLCDVSRRSRQSPEQQNSVSFEKVVNRVFEPGERAMTQNIGELFICATPIGNLEDITLRALRVLREVDLIAAEDTRRTRKLLTHFDIHTALISYHQHNALSRIPELVSRLKSGQNIAVVSDAGTPGISDPGLKLIQAAIEEEITIIPIPGPSAVVTALVAAGFDTDVFVFGGFIPRSGREKREFIEKAGREHHTTVLYETPHRLIDTLRWCVEMMPERPLAICRELTKMHEEILRGYPQALLEHFRETPPRGEFVLVLSAVAEEQKGTEAEAEEDYHDCPIEEAVRDLLAEGYDKKTAIKTVAQRRGIPKREVYGAVIDIPAVHKGEP